MKLDVAGILFMASLLAVVGLFFLLVGLHARKRRRELRGDLPRGGACGGDYRNCPYNPGDVRCCLVRARLQ